MNTKTITVPATKKVFSTIRYFQAGETHTDCYLSEDEFNDMVAYLRRLEARGAVSGIELGSEVSWTAEHSEDIEYIESLEAAGIEVEVIYEEVN